MNIQTPQMFYRKLFTEAGIDVDTYMDAVVHGTFMLKGSATVLQDDFRNWAFTPSTSMSRNSVGDVACASGVAALTAGANANFVANSDLVICGVGVPDSAQTTLMSRLVGASASGVAFENAWLGAAGSRFRDDDNLSALQAASMSNAATLMPTLGSTNVGLISTIDVSNGSSQSQADCIVYNVDTQADITTGTGTSATLVDGTYTLASENVAVSGWSAYMGDVVFAFPGHGRPTTWEADMKALAAAVVARRG